MKIGLFNVPANGGATLAGELGFMFDEAEVALTGYEASKPYTHACVLVDEVAGIIIEAVMPKVRQRQLTADEIDGARIDWFDVPSMTAEGEASAVLWLGSQVGVDYSLKTDLAFVLHELSATKLHGLICSQTAFLACVKGGVPPLARINSWQVSPTQLGTSPLFVGPVKLTSPV